MDDLEDYLALAGAFGPEDAQARVDEYRDACAPGRAEAERLMTLPPGKELLAGLEAIKAMLLDRRSRALVRTCWQRQLSYTHAQALAALVDAAGAPSTDLARKTIPDLARQAGQSEAAVGMELSEGLHMRDALPLTWEALNAGDIRPAHARMLSQVTYRVDAALTRKVEETLLSKAVARHWTPGELAGAARREVLRLDPEGAKQRADAAKKTADVTLRPEEDEMAVVNAYGDAFTNRQILDEINQRADAMQRAGDERSVGERRMGALARAVLGEDTTLDEPLRDAAAPAPVVATAGRRPNRATALLLVNLATLLGGSGPAYLDGYGPICAETARKIAAQDLKFRRLVFDPMTGKPVELSVDTYELSEQMRRWINVRDRCCMFPGCNRRAVYCDADHAIEYPKGKTTCENCGLLCRRHHNLKTKKWWKLRRNADDSCDWESPLGFRYHRPASTYEEFLDDPDPPDPRAPLTEVDSSDPDPPDDDMPWLWEVPPPRDDRDVKYDETAAYLRGSRTWQVAS